MTWNEIKIRVGYKDTDQMGVVHHSNYVVYYETARTELMRTKGISYREMEERGIMMPVREVHIEYLAPARYDDILTIKIRLAEPMGVKCVFEHEIYNEAGELLNRARVVLVFTNAHTRRPCRVPEWFKNLFE